MFYSTLLVLSASPRNDYWLCCSLHQADVFLWYIQLFVLLSCRWHVNIVRISHFSRHRSSSAALPCTISLWWLFCKTFRIYLSPLNTISTVMLPKDNITVDNMTTWSSEMKIYWNILYFEDWTVSQGYFHFCFLLINPQEQSRSVPLSRCILLKLTNFITCWTTVCPCEG